MTADKLTLADAVLSEIGNNAFDHNVGNWRDVPGVLECADGCATFREKAHFVAQSKSCHNGSSLFESICRNAAGSGFCLIFGNFRSFEGGA
jgi:hypothetical protein